MNKILIICLLFLIICCGCDIMKKNINQKDEITIYCNQDSELTLPGYYKLYEDDDYIYQMAYVNSYVIYNNEHISFEEALKNKIVTIEDLSQNCIYLYKEKK